jgi:hypothetical protein
MGPRRRRLAVLLLTFGALVGACSSPAGDDASPTTTTTAPDRDDQTSGTDPDVPLELEDGVGIEVLSSQPDRVTGPEARIRVTPAPGREANDLVVTLEGVDVTGQLAEVDGALEGVVVGLVEGTNTVDAHHRSEPTERAIQRIRSWPLTGPMISGPHIPLLACSTEEQGLGAPTDEHCSAPTRVWWRYVDSAGAVRDLADPATIPDDATEVTVATAEGDVTVPFVLRHERGVLNRSVYDIVTIDPSPAGSDADQSDAAWNGRLVHRFGGGCATTHGQGASLTIPTDVRLLQEGYAVTTASFTTGAVQCNDVVSAETVMMVKERFIELFGRPEHTIGEGTSGGAIQVQLITQNYPGLLDGGVVLEGFPDAVTTLSGVADCLLLERWYATPTGAALTPEQRTAVNGHATHQTCGRWQDEFADVFVPDRGCDPAIDASAVYHPTTNPTGVRCTYQDGSASVFGTDPTTGAALRPIDNVGVQYGLGALNDGTISFSQFVTLNREIGGLDADGAHQTERHEADFEAVARAYETGRVSAGVGDQRKVPLLAVDVWSDPSGDIHDRIRPFAMRDRLTQLRSPNAAPGYQIWTRDPVAPGPEGHAAATATALHEALALVDRWIADLHDGTPGPLEERLADQRPTAAGDTCTVPGRSAPARGLHIYDEGEPCAERYPVSGLPRTVAGGPRSDDVLKCMLKPVDPDDYEQALTQTQYEMLLEVFPVGVCDWTAAGVGQTTPSMSDRSFDDVVTPEQLA